MMAITCPKIFPKFQLEGIQIALSFKEEEYAKTPKFQLFFKVFFQFQISKIGFLELYKGKKAISGINRFLTGDL